MLLELKTFSKIKNMSESKNRNQKTFLKIKNLSESKKVFETKKRF